MCCGWKPQGYLTFLSKVRKQKPSSHPPHRDCTVSTGKHIVSDTVDLPSDEVRSIEELVSTSLVMPLIKRGKVPLDTKSKTGHPMSREQHYGINTLEIERGSRPVKTGESSVIRLVGTAYKGQTNTLTLLLGKDNAQFMAMR